jgi:hypothetical protein
MSLSGNPSGTAEHAFWVSQSPIWKPWIGPTFTSGFQRQITGEMAQRTMPSVLGSILTLYYVRPLLIHAHPNNPPPSPVNQGDIGAAAQLGATIVAIDKAGNLTCTKH